MIVGTSVPILQKYFKKQLYENILNNPDGMNKLLEIYNLSRLNNYE